MAHLTRAQGGRVGNARRGALLVEAALVLPLLLLLTFGLIEYGWLFLKSQQIENIARQAARYGAMADTTTAKVTQLVTDQMTAMNLQNSGYTLTIALASTTNPTPGSQIEVGTLTSGAQFRVIVSLPYTNIAITHASLIPVPGTISRSLAMAKEGP